MAAPLTPLQAFPVVEGRSLAAQWWELHLACGAGNTRGSEQKKRRLLRGVPPGSSQRTPWSRLADGSSGRYVGRLVLGSLQAVAAAMKHKALPHHRVKQLLYKPTGMDIIRRLCVHHMSVFQRHGKLFCSQNGGKGDWLASSLSRRRCMCIWRCKMCIRKSVYAFGGCGGIATLAGKPKSQFQEIPWAAMVFAPGSV